MLILLYKVILTLVSVSMLLVEWNSVLQNENADVQIMNQQNASCKLGMHCKQM